MTALQQQAAGAAAWSTSADRQDNRQRGQAEEDRVGYSLPPIILKKPTT